MADQNKTENPNDRLTRMIAAATTGSTSNTGSSGEDSFDLDETGDEESDEDSAPIDGEDDTSDTEDTTENADDEGDEASDETDDETEAADTDEDGAEEDTDTDEVIEEEVVQATPTPIDLEVAALRQQVAFFQAQMLAAQAPKPVPDPVDSELDDLPEDLVRGVLFGTLPAEKFRELPQNVQARLSKAYERYSREEARYAKNPALRYQEQFKQRVQEQVEALVRPLIDDLHNREVDRLTARYLDTIPKTHAGVRERAVQILATLPGVSTAGWKEKEKLLDTAVKLATGEFLGRSVDANKKRTGAKKAQAKAAGGAKLKGTHSTKGNGKSGGIPDMKDNEKPGDYAKRIAKYM